MQLNDPQWNPIPPKRRSNWERQYRFQALAVLLEGTRRRHSWKMLGYTKAQEELRSGLVDQLAELNALEADFKPTAFANTITTNMITRLYSMPVVFPLPSIAPDGDGGIILDWEHRSRLIRLVIADTPHGNSYIYHQDSDGYAAESDVSLENIKSWLTWLTRN